MSQEAELSEQDFYHQAFKRNIGLLSLAEQERLRRASVAIAGAGGMGGVHIATLARTGIGKFRIADLDGFEVVNFNRQYGATVHTIGRHKAKVMAEVACAINPEAEVTIFDKGISESNIDDFLEGADVVVDALDYFIPDTRRLLFRKAREKGLHVVTVGPIGFSAAMLIFSPTGMSFDDYFGFQDDMSLEEKLIAFTVGVAPGGTHLNYIDPKSVDFDAGAGPSLGLACQIGSGIAAAEIVNILLQRRPTKAAPYYTQFDPYTMQYKKGYLWRGNKNPVQQLKFWYVNRLLKKGREARANA